MSSGKLLQSTTFAFTALLFATGINASVLAQQPGESTQTIAKSNVPALTPKSVLIQADAVPLTSDRNQQEELLVRTVNLGPATAAYARSKNVDLDLARQHAIRFLDLQNMESNRPVPTDAQSTSPTCRMLSADRYEVTATQAYFDALPGMIRAFEMGGKSIRVRLELVRFDEPTLERVYEQIVDQTEQRISMGWRKAVTVGKLDRETFDCFCEVASRDQARVIAGSDRKVLPGDSVTLQELLTHARQPDHQGDATPEAPLELPACRQLSFSCLPVNGEVAVECRPCDEPDSQSVGTVTRNLRRLRQNRASGQESQPIFATSLSAETILFIDSLQGLSTNNRTAANSSHPPLVGLLRVQVVDHIESKQLDLP